MRRELKFFGKKCNNLLWQSNEISICWSRKKAFAKSDEREAKEKKRLKLGYGSCDINQMVKTAINVNAL